MNILQLHLVIKLCNDVILINVFVKKVVGKLFCEADISSMAAPFIYLLVTSHNIFQFKYFL